MLAQTSPTLLLLAPALAFLGAILGALVPKLLERRTAAQARYDAAVTAVTRWWAYRAGVGLHIPRTYLRSPNDSAHATAEHDLSVTAVRRWLDAAATARAALAALYPYSPDLQPYWDRFEIVSTEDELDVLLAVLHDRRTRPTKKHVPERVPNGGDSTATERN